MHYPNKAPRRIVTGYKEGKSGIIEDKLVDNVEEHIPGLFTYDIWATNTMPVVIDKPVIISNTLFPNTPKNGTYFRYVQIPPDTELTRDPLQRAAEKNNFPHPLMHQTNTIDYIIILYGELYLILDSEETLLKPGDIVIQQGTNHAWSNRSDKPCIQLAILLDANSVSFL